jgi:Lon protease-like protein
MPLHIFEERYKEMIGEAIGHHSEFGIVLAQGPGIQRTGCTAVVERVLERHDDGKLDILCAGRRRFTIEQLDTERAFLRARVDFFDDDDAALPDPALVEHAFQTWALLEDSGAHASSPSPRDPRVSFLLAQISEDVQFRQTLLDLRSEATRLERTARHLDELLRKKRLGDDARRSARVNGHARHFRGGDGA